MKDTLKGGLLVPLMAWILIVLAAIAMALLSYRPVESTNVDPLYLPFFSGNAPYDQWAVLKFGTLDTSATTTNLRAGWDSTNLYLDFNTVDRLLYYSTSLNTTFDSTLLEKYDSSAASITVGTSTYKFVSQMNWWEPRANYQGYFKNGTFQSQTGFATTSNWRGNQPNDTQDDNGYMEGFTIPWATLGVTPRAGQSIAVTMTTHNSTTGDGTVSDQSWVGNFILGGSSEAQLPPLTNITGAKNITETIVTNGSAINVGGYTQCGMQLGSGTDWFHLWGLYTWGNQDYLNVMNQGDVADWPCFNEVYGTYPLTSIPSGKVLVAAYYTLFQYAHAGDPGQAPPPSLIQLSELESDFDPATIDYNNAPAPLQNTTYTWASLGRCDVFPTPHFCPPVTFNVTSLVQKAYQQGSAWRFVLYEADSSISSGKYFISPTNGGAPQYVPQLHIIYGDPN